MMLVTLYVVHFFVAMGMILWLWRLKFNEILVKDVVWAGFCSLFPSAVLVVSIVLVFHFVGKAKWMNRKLF